MPAAIAIPWLGTAIAGAAGAGAGIVGAHMQSSGARNAANQSTAAANHAADLEAQAAQQQLAFQKEQAALVEKNYLGTRDFNRQVYQDQQSRLSPYRALGQGAIGQIANAPPGIGRLPGVR